MSTAALRLIDSVKNCLINTVLQALNSAWNFSRIDNLCLVKGTPCMTAQTMMINQMEGPVMNLLKMGGHYQNSNKP